MDLRASLWAIATLVLSGCTGIPAGLTAVRGFEPDRYLGTWYEIARLDHWFERGLEDVTAAYSRPDPSGPILVVNRGFDPAKGEWSEVEGTAKFQGDETTASLSVTFFWPFAGGYHVIDLDPDYRWALVCGPSRSFLWILARDPQLPGDVRARLVERARASGFATNELIWVGQRP